MANDYFRFQQFTIQQQHCAMKTCTDACLFGGLLPAVLSPAQPPLRALDIGTGTGLLSLMYAQKISTTIDAVEIDEAAAQQAQQNIYDSPWSHRINLLHGDINHLPLPYKYEFIFSNPPFFENDLKSDDHRRNLALHSNALTLEQLYGVADKYLTDDGIFSLLLPYRRTDTALALCKQYQWHTAHHITARQTPKHAPFRTILSMSRKPVETKQTEIIIQGEKERYSKEFTELLRDYYLYL